MAAQMRAARVGPLRISRCCLSFKSGGAVAQSRGNVINSPNWLSGAQLGDTINGQDDAGH